MADPMSASLDLDIAAMVGEMEALPCEHSQHGDPNCAHDDGPATHYIKSDCESCQVKLPVRPVCAAYVSLVRANGPMHCTDCGREGVAADFITILSPVKP